MLSAAATPVLKKDPRANVAPASALKKHGCSVANFIWCSPVHLINVNGGNLRQVGNSNNVLARHIPASFVITGVDFQKMLFDTLSAFLSGARYDSRTPIITRPKTRVFAHGDRLCRSEAFWPFYP